MALCLVHVCGPEGTSTNALSTQLARRMRAERPIHVQLTYDDNPSDALHPAGDHAGACLSPYGSDAVASLRYAYHPDRVFELWPRVLGEIKALRRWATVLLETDAEACHRHAGKHDLRVFVMPAPHDTHDVFRREDEAESALAGMMEDTISFAREMYGLTPNHILDQSRFGAPMLRAPDDSGTIGGGAATGTSVVELDRLLDRSPAIDDDELGVRVRFHPAYQGIVDSDVVILDTSRGGRGMEIDDVARRIDWVHAGMRRAPGREPLLAVCDLDDPEDPMHVAAMNRITSIINAVKGGWP